MSTTADIPVEDGVAHIAINAGPASRLSVPVLQQIDAALSHIEDHTDAEIVILAGKGLGFPSGLTEPQAGGDDRDRLLARLCSRIETFPKPVVAVLTGAVVGGGAELALACHYRLVQRDARIGFPHARLGLVPSAGATQRLPRLAGAGLSLDLLLGGQMVPLAAPKAAPLVDHHFDGNRYEAIVAFVETLRSNGAAPRPTAQVRDGFADGQAYQAAINAAKTRLDPVEDIAAAEIVSAIEAALVLPMEAGLAFEEAAAEDCAETPVSRALSHLFHAEQTLSAQTRRTDLPEIDRVALLGPGPLAAQIAVSALDAGLRVDWMIRDAAQRQGATAHVQQLLQNAVTAGRMQAERATACLAALQTGDSAALLDGAGIVLRTARGQRGVTVPPEIPLAHCLTGTDPRLAMRFAPASASIRAVEVIMGPEGTDTDLKAALGLARRLNTLAVVQHTSGPCLQDRLVHALMRGADALVDMGQSPYAIDAAMRGWGMALPPYVLADTLGLEAMARQHRADAARNWSALLIQLGHAGRASGHGFYTYPPEGAPVPTPTVDARLNEMRPTAPDLPAARIRRLLIGAMANEGARALRDGVVPRASDIDLVSVSYGLLPRWCGGVMHHAHTEGLLQISRAMTELAHADTGFWTPDPVFAELIKYGRGFDDR